jgi:hypothetical protein
MTQTDVERGENVKSWLVQILLESVSLLFSYFQRERFYATFFKVFLIDQRLLRIWLGN